MVKRWLWFIILLIILAAFYGYQLIVPCEDGIFIFTCSISRVLFPIAIGISFLTYGVLRFVWGLIKRTFWHGSLGVMDTLVLGLCSLILVFGNLFFDRSIFMQLSAPFDYLTLIIFSWLQK